MSKLNNVYVVKAINFCPYPETGEFACIGIVMYSLSSGYFDYKLAVSKDSARVRSRVRAFFPEIQTNVFKAVFRYIDELLKNVREISVQGDFFLSSKELVKNLCRPRENIISFGPSSAVSCSDPGQELMSQFNNRVLRGFVQKEQCYLSKMESTIRRQFQEAAILFRRREFATKYKDFNVSLPFCFGGDIGMRAIKPLDFGRQIKDVVSECLKWKYCAEQLQEVTSGIRLLCPARYPDKGSSTYQAMHDILAGSDAFDLCQYVDGDKELQDKLIEFAKSA